MHVSNATVVVVRSVSGGEGCSASRSTKSGWLWDDWHAVLFAAHVNGAVGAETADVMLATNVPGTPPAPGFGVRLTLPVNSGVFGRF